MIEPRLVSRSRHGSALMLVAIFIAIIGITLSSLLTFSTHERRQAARMQIYQDELTAAEEASDAMVGEIRFFAQNKPKQVGGAIQNFHNAVLALQAPAIPGYDLAHTSIQCIDGGDLQYETINDPADQWNGYAILRVDYQINAQAHATSNNSERLAHPGVALQRTVRLQQIPLYAYAIFYSNELELDAGQRIDVIGRVHTNSDFYLTTSSSAYYHRAVTVAGHLYAGMYDPKTGRTGSGSEIYVTTDGKSSPSNSSTMASPYKNGQWLDSRSSTWVADATNRWNGYLRDSSFGIVPIGLPIPSTENPHQLIEAPSSSDSSSVANVKFADNADLTISGDPNNLSSITAKDKNGNTVPLSYKDGSGVTQNIVSVSSIYNGRENKTVKMLNVDMSKFIAAGINVGQGIVYINPAQPSGGSYESAVRLTNASKLPTNVSGAITIASSGPLYTKGDVNTNNTAVALLAGDSINILSKNFNDSNYQTQTQAYNPQSAAPTTTNAIFLAGNVPSNGGRYSGGAENYFRYLENWGSDNTHTFNGSLLNLYQSQIATGPWDQDPTMNVQSAPYYSPPRRIWSWDPNLAGVTPPPGMPTFLQVNLMDWQLATPQS